MGRSDANTMKFEDGIWAVPVEEPDDLWPLAVDGQLCFVKSVNEVYERRDGAWICTGRALPAGLSSKGVEPA